MNNFSASESPRCSHCLKMLQYCNCTNIKPDGLKLRLAVKIKAGVIISEKINNLEAYTLEVSYERSQRNKRV